MPLKRWILQGMNRMNGLVGRPDLAPRTVRSQGAAPREPSLRGLDSVHEAHAPAPDHLGAYAPLIAAVADELEHFVASQLRLHLAIAERDRYLLTSIEVESVDGGDGAELLRRFTREFTPEQIKRFLARDVIAHLRNASAIDLSQFAGLNAARAHDDLSEQDRAYAELVAQLRATSPGEGPRAFDVTLLGRWTDADAGATTLRGGVPAQAGAPCTPLAGLRAEFGIEDADGPRDVALTSVVPNRRYAIGKGEGCDVVVRGTFASRRHCEIWLENGAWWAADAGSTNGIRVETAREVLGRSGDAGAERGSAQHAIRLVPGAAIVLSSIASGRPADYPRIALKVPAQAATPAPSGGSRAAPATPVTPIAAPRARTAKLTLCASMASGVRTIDLAEARLPIRIGRSRAQDIVVDWAHEGVSGHHVDIARMDEDGVDVVVVGDNGVTVEGVTRATGERFRWRVGERMTLGRACGDEPECTLTLSTAA